VSSFELLQAAGFRHRVFVLCCSHNCVFVAVIPANIRGKLCNHYASCEVLAVCVSTVLPVKMLPDL